MGVRGHLNGAMPTHTNNVRFARSLASCVGNLVKALLMASLQAAFRRTLECILERLEKGTQTSLYQFQGISPTLALPSAGQEKAF